MRNVLRGLVRSADLCCNARRHGEVVRLVSRQEKDRSRPCSTDVLSFEHVYGFLESDWLAGLWGSHGFLPAGCPAAHRGTSILPVRPVSPLLALYGCIGPRRAPAGAVGRLH